MITITIVGCSQLIYQQCMSTFNKFLKSLPGVLVLNAVLIILCYDVLVQLLEFKHQCIFIFWLLEETEIPTKCICMIETLDILANVLYIDFEGRSDGESIRKILTQVKPRQLVSIFESHAYLLTLSLEMTGTNDF